jgi:hypothetical protein
MHQINFFIFLFVRCWIKEITTECTLIAIPWLNPKGIYREKLKVNHVNRSANIDITKTILGWKPPQFIA